MTHANGKKKKNTQRNPWVTASTMIFSDTIVGRKMGEEGASSSSLSCALLSRPVRTMCTTERSGQEGKLDTDPKTQRLPLIFFSFWSIWTSTLGEVLLFPSPLSLPSQWLLSSEYLHSLLLHEFSCCFFFPPNTKSRDPPPSFFFLPIDCRLFLDPKERMVE